MKNLTTKLFAIASVFCALTLTSCMDLYDGFETPLIGTLTLNGNGGHIGSETGPTSQSRTFEKGKEVITLNNPFDKSPSENQVFSGWAESPNATMPKYGVGAKTIFKYDTTLYAVWRTTGLYVKSTGNDNNDGLTVDSALRTLKQAIKRINDKLDNNAVWKVTIIDNVTGNTSIESIIAAKVIITGKESDTDTEFGSLTGDGDKSVITIDGSGTMNIEFDHITITNGYANVTSDDDWKGSKVTGGGLNIINSSATVTLNEDTVITQNNAAYGGGVYNKGTLNINGGAQIISNNAKGLDTEGENAGCGGGIYNTGTANFDGSYSVTSNNANYTAGGLYNYTGSTLSPTITDLRQIITGNTAASSANIKEGSEKP